MLYSAALEKEPRSVAQGSPCRCPRTRPSAALAGRFRRTRSELAEHIAATIVAEGDWIPFSRYMELALYAPGLGYYAAGARKFGSEGDFVTSPEISPMFARCFALQARAGAGGGGRR